MIELGAHLSMTERRADDASRDVEQWLKCEYMRDKVGDNFNGVYFRSSRLWSIC